MALFIRDETRRKPRVRRAVAFWLVLFVGQANAAVITSLPFYNPYGVDGSTVVGGSVGVSFVYDTSTKTTNLLPPPPNSFGHSAFGVSGTNIVGTYTHADGIRKGYLYDGSSYATLEHPLAAPGSGKGTKPEDIQGNRVVGYYIDAANRQHGFLYDITTQAWTTLDYPGANGTRTFISAIEGNFIVGYATNTIIDQRAFIYDISTQTWTTFGFNGDQALDIDGTRIVGNFGMYDMLTKTFSNPLAGAQWPTGQAVRSYRLTGISGRTLTGTYNYLAGNVSVTSGFVYTMVPEVPTFFLTSLAAAICFLWHRHRRSTHPEGPNFGSGPSRVICQSYDLEGRHAGACSTPDK